MAKSFNQIALALQAIQPEPHEHHVAPRPHKTQHSQCSPRRITSKVNVALGQSAQRPRNWPGGRATRSRGSEGTLSGRLRGQVGWWRLAGCRSVHPREPV